jgi:putative phosphoribosyl transferase
MKTATLDASEQSVRIRAGAAGTRSVLLEGDLGLRPDAAGVVLFAHGSGSGRHSPRNRFVAQKLREAGLATLLVDLLTEEEEVLDRYSGHLRFDIVLLADRLLDVTDWLAADARTAGLSLGYFGASTGGGAALVAAARRPERVAGVVSRGGRPDLAGESLSAVRAPTLLIVGGDDEPVIGLNEAALDRLGATVKEMVIVPGASHLFEEPGKLEEVARLAADWFARCFAPQNRRSTPGRL